MSKRAVCPICKEYGTKNDDGTYTCPCLHTWYWVSYIALERRFVVCKKRIMKWTYKLI